jgi:hypothetical protein
VHSLERLLLVPRCMDTGCLKKEVSINIFRPRDIYLISTSLSTREIRTIVPPRRVLSPSTCTVHLSDSGKASSPLDEDVHGAP